MKKLIPFAGLGHDLEAVVFYAGELTICRPKRRYQPFQAGLEPERARTSGYELLLWLSREIRGT